MNRQQFKQFVSKKYDHYKQPLKQGSSITDPSFARTGRQLIFQPLPIEYRMKYPDGNLLDKENPHNIKEYDKIYPDQFLAMQQARNDIQTTKTKLNEIDKHIKQKQKQPNPETK